MTDHNDLKFKIAIAASVAEVYSAFISASALTEWLCDVAQVDAYEGGRLYLWWSSGYYANGEFIEVRPDERLVFSWHGRGEPGATQVKIIIKPDEQGARLSLLHQGIGGGKVWFQARKAIRKGWRQALENLKSVLETGRDLRLLRRPVLGVSGLDELTPEQASLLGLPVQAGLRLHGVLEGQGAQLAGLQKDDIIVKVAGRKVAGLNDLQAVLQQHEAGDKVKVWFYRGDERQSVKLVLSSRPLPEIPETAAELADQMREIYHRLEEELNNALEGTSEEGADFRSTPGEWTVKETLAHLIAAERDAHAWIARFLDGHEAELWFPTPHISRLSATVKTFSTLKALRDELRRNQAETVALLAGLPPEFVARKRSYWRLGYGLLNLPAHFRDHVQYIGSLLKMGREQYPLAEEVATQTSPLLDIEVGSTD